jgi:hypothetical protein
LRTSCARLSVLTALMVELGMLGAFAAPASAEGTTCRMYGSIMLNPGVVETPAREQTARVKGELECTGAIKRAKFRAKLRSALMNCETLTNEETPATGTIDIKWEVHPRKTSMGTISMPLAEEAHAPLSGMIEKGLFEGMRISGETSPGFPEQCFGKGEKDKRGFFFEEPRSELVIM